MAPGRNLSPLEWEVMSVIWKLGGAPSVRDVVESAYPRGEKAYTTVQTVMNNLERKGFLRKRKIGLVNFYAPTCQRGELVRGETRRFVERIFDGSFPDLASYLIRSAPLGADEINDLKRLIRERERELEEDGS